MCYRANSGPAEVTRQQPISEKINKTNKKDDVQSEGRVAWLGSCDMDRAVWRG